MSEVLQEIRKYQFDDGTTIHLSIDYEQNKVSFVERDMRRSDDVWVTKKWLFAERGEEYLNGWHNILSAMQYAIKDAQTRMLLYQKAAKDKKRNQIIKLFVALEDTKEMSDVSPYIDIVDAGVSPSGKTKVWHVVNKRNPNDIPGVIKWNGGWRKYVYYSIEAYYDWECLRQIANFIEDQTKIHKGK